jgi:hypothetical protein
MDRLKSLMEELHVLVKRYGPGSGASVELFENKIDSYLASLREAVNAEKAKRHLGENKIRTSVEGYIDRCKLPY